MRAAAHQMCKFDLYRVTVEDLECVADTRMEFQMDNDTVVDSLIVWFDVGFPNGSTLSTAPGCDTHWNQEILLLDEGLEMEAGDVLQVQLRLQRNAYWRRHYAFICKFVHVRNGEQIAAQDKTFPHHRFHHDEKGKADDDSGDNDNDEDSNANLDGDDN